MSFLSFDTTSLKSLLQIASSISTTRSTVELFTYTKIELLDEKIVRFSCIGDGISWSALLPSTNLEDLSAGFVFLVKTDLFSNAVQLASDALIGLEIDEEKNTMIVQSARSKHTLRINQELSAQFLIQEPTSEKETSFVIKTEILQDAYHNGLVSIGNPRSVYQPEFLNFAFTIRKNKKECIIATTDRYRVMRQQPVIKSLKTKIEQETKHYLVSPKVLASVDKFDGHENCTIEFYTDSVILATKTQKVIGKYGDGVYPDYEKIIPNSFVCSFSVATDDLNTAIKQVQYFARLNAESKAIKLDCNPSDKKIVFSSTTADGYQSESTVDIMHYDGPSDNWSQSFNIDYLASFLARIKSSHVLWEANPGKPSVLSPQNEKNTLLYLVSGLK